VLVHNGGLVDRGYPAVLRCDNGPGLVCAAMADSAGERTGLHFIPPGQPWRNGYVESFNSRVRDECLQRSRATRVQSPGHGSGPPISGRRDRASLRDGLARREHPARAYAGPPRPQVGREGEADQGTAEHARTA
jgi:hypothetical protein